MISNVAQHKSKNGILAPFWDSALIEKSASGSVASFADGADGMPMVSVLASIEPIQSGTGDPSPDNVRPISGWDAVEVTRSGKNLLDTSNAETVTRNGVSFVRNSDGSITASGTSTADWQNKLFSGYLPSGSYALSGGISSSVRLRLGQGSQNTLIGHDSGSGLSFTLTEETLINVNIRFANGADANVTIYPMIRLASETDATWESYTSQTYTTDLDTTRYGGTLDMVSGVLTLTHLYADLGDLTWTAYGNVTEFGGLFFTDTIKTTIAHVDKTKIYTQCSAYNSVPNTQSNKIGGALEFPDSGMRVRNSDGRIFVRDDRYSASDGAAFKTAVDGVQLVYELATPRTVRLSPTEITSLFGDNNLWADSGSVSVTYRADSTLAYEQLTTAIVSLGGNV